MFEKLNCYVAKVSIFLIAVALIAGMVGCIGGCYTPPPQNLEIWDWYDLDDVRDNLAGNHILMNDLDSTTAGYEELASPTANGGKGWQPIGTFSYCTVQQSFGEKFEGTFDGQGYEIRDLYINRPGESTIGLFGFVVEGGIIKNVSMINATVTSSDGIDGPAGLNEGTVRNLIGFLPPGADVGGLVGLNEGTVSNCHAMGNVTGDSDVGGLVGSNSGTVSYSYSTGNVTGNEYVGGLVGWNYGTVIDSHSTGSVTGDRHVGGLVGVNFGLGTASNSYSTGSVIGDEYVGGLAGSNGDRGTVSNSYSTGSVTGDAHVGGLVGHNYFRIGEGTVSNCFWDNETSGQTTSDGGMGKTTTEMKSIATFSGTGWDIIAVAPGLTNPAYTWNIIDDETYPFLSWEP
jgi:hypothetical protein